MNNLTSLLKLTVILVQYHFTKLVQRIFKLSNIQNISLTPDKQNNVMEHLSVSRYTEVYILISMVWFFWHICVCVKLVR